MESINKQVLKQDGHISCLEKVVPGLKDENVALDLKVDDLNMVCIPEREEGGRLAESVFSLKTLRPPLPKGAKPGAAWVNFSRMRQRGPWTLQELWAEGQCPQTQGPVQWFHHTWFTGRVSVILEMECFSPLHEDRPFMEHIITFNDDREVSKSTLWKAFMVLRRGDIISNT